MGFARQQGWRAERCGECWVRRRKDAGMRWGIVGSACTRTSEARGEEEEVQRRERRESIRRKKPDLGIETMKVERREGGDNGGADGRDDGDGEREREGEKRGRKEGTRVGEEREREIGEGERVRGTLLPGSPVAPCRLPLLK